MSYGFNVLTTEGLVNSFNLRSSRLYGSFQVSGTSGSLTVSGFDSNQGFIFPRPNDGKLLNEWSWNNNSKVFSWSPSFQSSDPSSDQTVFFIVTT